MAAKPEEYSSVQKAVEILLAFTEYNQEVGTLELSEKLGLHKSTVSRLLRLLSHYGLIQSNKKTKKYILGKSALDLGIAAKRYIDGQLIVTAQSFLNELRDRLGEQVSLEVISGNSSTVVCHAASSLPVRVSSDIGRSLPIYAVAGAKAILAFLPPEEIDELLADEFTAFTPNTITDPRKFRLQLEEARKQGYSLDRGEYYPEVHAIGAPVFNSEGRPVAAVVLPVPAFRMEALLQSNGVALVKETAAKISASLFFEDKAKDGTPL
jgi:IclR family acetate operon transcriptional repressor